MGKSRSFLSEMRAILKIIVFLVISNHMESNHMDITEIYISKKILKHKIMYQLTL